MGSIHMLFTVDKETLSKIEERIKNYMSHIILDNGKYRFILVPRGKGITLIRIKKIPTVTGEYEVSVNGSEDNTLCVFIIGFYTDKIMSKLKIVNIWRFG